MADFVGVRRGQHGPLTFCSTEEGDLMPGEIVTIEDATGAALAEVIIAPAQLVLGGERLTPAGVARRAWRNGQAQHTPNARSSGKRLLDSLGLPVVDRWLAPTE